jgi:hypothetical protein
MQVTPFMVLFAAFVGILSAFFAHRTDRNPYLWFFIGFFFGIFGVFAILFASKPSAKKQQEKKEPSFRIDGPTHKFWYYLDTASTQHGPMSHEALTRAWREGKINLSTYVWHEELPKWTLLKETLQVVEE